MKTELRNKPKLRNITIALEEDLARWARIEAAREDTSVSQLLAELLRRRRRDSNEYERARREALAREPFLNTDGKYLSREEVHERSRFRGQ
jgi:uncharacterized protein YqeY